MSRIRSSNTTPEIYIRSTLHRAGFRFRINCGGIFGNPDIYFSKKKVAVFVHGCYWHRHSGCKCAYVPKSNVDFWIAKFEANIKRDRIVLDTLRTQGIRVLIIWECAVKQMQKSPDKINEFLVKVRMFFSHEEIGCLEIDWR